MRWEIRESITSNAEAIEDPLAGHAMGCRSVKLI